MKPLLLLLSVALPCLALPGLRAETYCVDPAKGNDSNPGTAELPFRTTAKGIAKARAGDTVIIAKVDRPIRESLLIREKSGEEGKPITIDGQGNLFTGSDPLKPEEWSAVAGQPGVYRNDHLVPGLKPADKNNAFILQRYIMIWDDKPNRMGRTSKGRHEPFVPVEKLQPGQWTYVDAEAAFYVAIDPAKSLADYAIESPTRLNGVGISGTCEHWVVKNVRVSRVINDGFNLHGHTRDFVFENIEATECGDDGISEHEDSELTIHGLVSRRNSTGICHGDQTSSWSDHVVLEDNYAANLFLRNGTHVITDSVVSAAAPPDGNNGIILNNVPVPINPNPLSMTFTRCRFPFPSGANPTGKAPFYVDDGVLLTISDDSKVEGPVYHVPGRKGAPSAPAPAP
ncbi:hypothetical protein SAMN05444156_3124 [Verrucomicrobium sp. GAS474]|uniref:right-handed parallel beta-helix repeat-containing protein n=1 Tax=Verrucomicrobium sp. GAS474 TaxID=1882831 RepID=UPI00087B151E|nr:right-handed parallel beta-helix repeat-containing protein [Verrucomicrobium sp. GAS474]SDU29456.1 hypothetical protein SAMN05444156_3124 [Verrucomicrobium sp. GAS474]